MEAEESGRSRGGGLSYTDNTEVSERAGQGSPLRPGPHHTEHTRAIGARVGGDRLGAASTGMMTGLGGGGGSADGTPPTQ